MTGDGWELIKLALLPISTAPRPSCIQPTTAGLPLHLPLAPLQNSG